MNLAQGNFLQGLRPGGLRSGGLRSGGLRLLLCALFFCALCLGTSCTKNYNHYRDLIYGHWALVQEDGAPALEGDTLYFKTATAMQCTRADRTVLEGTYGFECRILFMNLSSKDYTLYREWDVVQLGDSVMVATEVRLREQDEELPATGLTRTYHKF